MGTLCSFVGMRVGRSRRVESSGTRAVLVHSLFAAWVITGYSEK
jgi:hypothetical protein